MNVIIILIFLKLRLNSNSQICIYLNAIFINFDFHFEHIFSLFTNFLFTFGATEWKTRFLCFLFRQIRIFVIRRIVMCLKITQNMITFVFGTSRITCGRILVGHCSFKSSPILNIIINNITKSASCRLCTANRFMMNFIHFKFASVANCINALMFGLQRMITYINWIKFINNSVQFLIIIILQICIHCFF